MIKLATIGLNHQTAPLAIREQLAFTAATLADALRDLLQDTAAEAVILSTCNRTEIYCVAEHEAVIQWWANYHNLNADDIRPYLYTYGCGETIHHAFRVACGLDSMVLGEPQILGQMKDAVRVATEQHALGTWLNALFQRTFSAAKDVRSHTHVGNNTVSMASASVKMAEAVYPDLSQARVLLVGAGEMNELVATYFAAKQPAKMMIANRSLKRAQDLCSSLIAPADSCLINDLPHILANYDVVISCTAAPLPIIGKGMVEQAMLQRNGKPLFMLDLAVPRDIEAQIAEMPNVVLKTVDDIYAIVETGKEARRAAAASAEQMVERKVAEFVDWQKQRQRVPLICALRDEGERARQYVLQNAMKQLAKGGNPHEVLERLSVQLTNKLLHAPTSVLNKDDDLTQAVSQIYRLQTPHHNTERQAA